MKKKIIFGIILMVFISIGIAQAAGLIDLSTISFTPIDSTPILNANTIGTVYTIPSYDLIDGQMVPANKKITVAVPIDEYTLCREVGGGIEECKASLTQKLTTALATRMFIEYQRLQELQRQSFLNELTPSDVEADVTRAQQEFDAQRTITLDTNEILPQNP